MSLSSYITLCFLLLNFFTAPKEEVYVKTFYNNGSIKSKGWLKNNIKVKYWYFYKSNGKKKSEGHYINGKKNNWWLFYDDREQIDHKCQLKDNVKNGYCLLYKNEKIVSAKKYKYGKPIKEWTDYKSFTKDNNLYDLK